MKHFFYPLLIGFFLLTGCMGNKYAAHTYRVGEGATQAQLGSIGIKTGTNRSKRNGYAIQRQLDWTELCKTKSTKDPLTEERYLIEIVTDPAITIAKKNTFQIGASGKYQNITEIKAQYDAINDKKGVFVIDRITNLHALANVINNTDSLKNLFLNAPEQMRIIIATVRVFDHEQNTSDELVITAKPDIPGNVPEIKLKISDDSTIELGNGSIVGYEFARACWSNGEILTFVPDQPGTDSKNCPLPSDEDPTTP